MAELYRGETAEQTRARFREEGEAQNEAYMRGDMSHKDYWDKVHERDAEVRVMPRGHRAAVNGEGVVGGY